MNDLPTALKKIALSLGDSIITDGNMMGGYTLSMHASDANTLAKIQAGNWDYVVIQAQSQEPSFDPTQVQTDTYPYAHILDSFVHAYNPCAETLFFMTWGRKNGDASNCAVYPPICTYAGMQQRLRESYLEMAQLNHASVSPVGVSWQSCRTQYPNLELYQADESHPSEAGTYLAACTFYSSLFHKTTYNADTVFSSITTSIAQNLQQLTFHTVIDSIENWQQYGDLPFANFSFVVNGNSVNFTELSERNQTWFWDFGDGTNSTQSNPVKNYTTAGNYLVTLTVSDSCKTDSKMVSINVGLPSGFAPSKKNEPRVHSYLNTISVRNGNGLCLIVYNAAGQLIVKRLIDTQNFNEALNAVPEGMYYYRIVGSSGISAQGNWLIKY